MKSSGLALVVLASCCQLLVSAQQSHHAAPASRTGSTSWFRMVSCLANQVPKLSPGFDKPLYQYLFETFARNTHLLPLGVPMHSKSEDFESTAEFEKCLWGKTIINPKDIEGEKGGNDLDPENKSEGSAYQQLFASRQGGFDSLTGFSLLGGKVVAALVGYIIYALTNAG